MKHIKFIAPTMLLGFSSLALATDMINPSFETGDLSGWQSTTPVGTGGIYVNKTYMGKNSDTTYTAPWGDYFAVVVASCDPSELEQTFSAVEGDSLLGWSFFEDNEPDVFPDDDTGVVNVVMESDNSTTLLFQYSVLDVRSGGNPGWVPWEFTAPENGEYTIRAISTNPTYCNDSFDSAVGIDLGVETGGMVTGAGWIVSPPGAYVNVPDLTGRANFMFVSQYKKGANKPTGRTTFKFKAGDLDFYSDDYDFLVVNKAATNAQFKGVGTVNGEGNYGFMIWATDYSNSPDTFRIKIWDDADNIIYDNDMQQPIGAGNIVVRDK